MKRDLEFNAVNVNRLYDLSQPHDPCGGLQSSYMKLLSDGFRPLTMVGETILFVRPIILNDDRSSKAVKN